MNNLRSKIEEILESYAGAPAIDLIREEIFTRIKKIIEDDDSVNKDLFIELEQMSDCFTGKFIMIPLEKISNIRTL